MSNLRIDISGETEETLTRIKSLTQIESLSGVLKWLVDSYGQKAIIDLEDFYSRVKVVSQPTVPQVPSEPKPALEPVSQPGEAKSSFSNLLGSLGD